jgi:hypothetical protein
VERLIAASKPISLTMIVSLRWHFDEIVEPYRAAAAMLMRALL